MRNPDDWETNPKHWRRHGLPSMLGRLRFHPLDLISEAYQKDNNKGVMFEKGNEEFDLLWTKENVSRWGPHGKVSQIVSAERIDGVHWDGRVIWTVGSGQGLRVYSERGELISKLDECNGLPPSDGVLKLAILEPGRGCLVGSILPYYRSWCAMVELGGEQQLSFDVFYEAKNMPTASNPYLRVGDASLAFRPAYLYFLNPAAGDDPILLIGRGHTTLFEGRHPLAINMRTRDVWVYRHAIGSVWHSQQLYSKGGELIQNAVRHSSVRHWEKENPASTSSDFRRYSLLEEQLGRHGLSYERDRAAGWLVEHGEYVYVPSPRWFRIHTQTFETELLIAGRKPIEWQFHWIGSSDRYGLVGLRQDGEYYRIEIADEHLPPIPGLSLGPFDGRVPNDGATSN